MGKLHFSPKQGQNVAFNLAQCGKAAFEKAAWVNRLNPFDLTGTVLVFRQTAFRIKLLWIRNAGDFTTSPGSSRESHPAGYRIT